MPSFPRIASAVVVVGLVAGQAVPSSAADNPYTRRQRLEAAGFEATEIDLGDYQFRFRTRKS